VISVFAGHRGEKEASLEREERQLATETCYGGCSGCWAIGTPPNPEILGAMVARFRSWLLAGSGEPITPTVNPVTPAATPSWLIARGVGRTLPGLERLG